MPVYVARLSLLCTQFSMISDERKCAIPRRDWENARLSTITTKENSTRVPRRHTTAYPCYLDKREFPPENGLQHGMVLAITLTPSDNRKSTTT